MLEEDISSLSTVMHEFGFNTKEKQDALINILDIKNVFSEDNLIQVFAQIHNTDTLDRKEKIARDVIKTLEVIRLSNQEKDKTQYILDNLCKELNFDKNDTRDFIIALSQSLFGRKLNQERCELEAPEGNALELIKPYIETLGSAQEVTPEEDKRDNDVIAILGAGRSTMQARLDSALQHRELYKNDAKFFMLAGSRELWLEIDYNGELAMSISKRKALAEEFLSKEPKERSAFLDSLDEQRVALIEAEDSGFIENLKARGEGYAKSYLSMIAEESKDYMLKMAKSEFGEDIDVVFRKGNKGEPGRFENRTYAIITRQNPERERVSEEELFKEPTRESNSCLEAEELVLTEATMARFMLRQKGLNINEQAFVIDAKTPEKPRPNTLDTIRKFAQHNEIKKRTGKNPVKLLIVTNQPYGQRQLASFEGEQIPNLETRLYSKGTSIININSHVSAIAPLIFEVCDNKVKKEGNIRKRVASSLYYNQRPVNSRNEATKNAWERDVVVIKRYMETKRNKDQGISY